MSEQLPPERQYGKFNSLRDQMLYLLTQEGWANEECGDAQSPVGWFARISFVQSELAEVVAAFEDDFRTEAFTAHDELLGHFLLSENDQGFVGVETFDDAPTLMREYDARCQAFLEWAGGGNS